MLSNCHSLSSININNFDTKNVLSMNKVFYNCISLPSIDVSNFDTTKVTTMKSMFEKCTELKTLNLSNFRPISNIDYSQMFLGCTKLEYVNFYNFFENATTNFNDLIKNAYNNIKLCVHVTNKTRIYSEYSTHLLEECLIFEEIEKLKAATDGIKEDSTQSVENVEKISTEKAKEESPQETEKKEQSTDITKSITDELEKNDNTLDTNINDITQTNLISHDDIIINDTFFY